jgi:DDE superfamily endonuclease
MEHILDLYAEPYDPERPLICFDERPYQLLGGVYEPVPAAPGKPRREDYEYQRQGTCNLLLAFEPLTGWRHITVTKTRKHPDFAQVMQELIKTQSPDVKDLRVVVDNLSTHTPAAFYQTFEPTVARALTKKISFHYTPKPSRWLNMAEGEFSVLSRQRLQQRIATQEHLEQTTQHWATPRTEKQITINWQFTTEKARAKFRRFYPH